MIPQVTPAEVKARLEAKEQFVLLDVREPWEYEISRIEGTVLIPLRTLPALLGTLNMDDEIIIHCHHGHRSYQACIFLQRKGFTNVKNLEGGIEAWAELDPTVKRY